MDRAFLRPPPAVRVAMERVQMGIESKQDETLVKQWLDFACQRAVSAAQTGLTEKCSLDSPRTKRPTLSGRELPPYMRS